MIRPNCGTPARSAPRPVAGLLVALSLIIFAAGCNTSEIQPRPTGEESEDDSRTQEQPLGESTQAYSFDGDASSTIPSYDERLALHLINRMRMDPDAFGLEGPMGGQLPPQRLLPTDPAVIEAGRWQGQHGLSRNCLCPQNEMQGAPEAVKNSCCTMARQKGQVVCTSETVACGDDKATEEQRRWNLLGTGTASVSDEFYVTHEQLGGDPPYSGELLAGVAAQALATYITSPRPSAFGVSQVTQPQVPEECQEPEDPCTVGTCTNPANGNNLCDEEVNPECTGVCQGEACDGICEETNEETGETEPVECELPTAPDPEECDPSEYPRGSYVSYLQANSTEPIPTLTSGLHWQLGQGDITAFGTTSAGQVGFGIHYYEPSGEADEATLVVEGQCESLEVEKRNVTRGTVSNHDAGTGDTTIASPDSSSSDTSSSDSSSSDASNDIGSSDAQGGGDTSGGVSEYFGLRYGTEVDLDSGCHRYLFSFRDGDGFIHTYPSYGSLGAKVEQGSVVANDENCPIWSAERPDQSCLPEGDQCVSGETRSCYTARDNTRGRGICENGTESCQNGRWSGVCEGEVTPEGDEKCGDGRDNNCNGFVDEGCDEDTQNDAGTTDTGGPDTGVDTGSSTDTGSTSEDDTGTDETSSDAGTSDDAGGPTVSDDDSDDDSDSGCGCASNGSQLPPMAPSIVLFALGFAAVRRESAGPN